MAGSLLLALRVLVSLAVVVALVWYLARRVGGRGADRSREAEVRVLDRQGLGRRSGVAVIAAGDRRLLVGFADQGVQLLTELAPVPALPKPVTPTAAAGEPRRTAAGAPIPSLAGSVAGGAPAGPGANRRPGLLAGSVLSPQTWHATLRAMQDRTVRR